MIKIELHQKALLEIYKCQYQLLAQAKIKFARGSDTLNMKK